MNLTRLLQFIPLIVGVFLAYHLIFKLQLPSKSIGAIVTYFIGIIIVILALTWILSTFLPDYANNLLSLGRDGSSGWGEFINGTTQVVEESIPGITDGTQPVPNSGGSSPPTTVNNGNNSTVIVVTPLSPAVPTTDAVVVDSNGVAIQDASGRTIHVVGEGDTLLSISRLYNVPLEDIRLANGIYTDTILVGQEIIIPAQTQPADDGK